MGESGASSYFKFNNPLFLDLFVATVLFVIYASIRKRWPRLGDMVKEASLIFLIFMFYDMSRFFALSSLEEATANADKVIRFEKATGLDIELYFQEAVLPYESFTKFLGSFYLAAHWGSIVLFFVWTVTRIGGDPRKREEYNTARGRFMIMNFIACIIFMAFPCAPPRMMPGFVDTLRKSVDVYSSTRRWVNPYAAMPSMHIGYSVLFTVSTIQILRAAIKHRSKDNTSYECLESGITCDTKKPLPGKFNYVTLLPFVLLAYPIFMVFTIVATANHFILDAFAGFCCFSAAVGLYRLVCIAIEKIREKYFHEKKADDNRTYISVSVNSVEMERRNSQEL